MCRTFEELFIESSLNFGEFLTSTHSPPRAGIAMFAQGGGNSQYRTGGQSGLFSTPQQSSPFSSSYNQANSATPGAAASSSAFGGSSSTFAGPQFGGGNHGAAFGASGQFGGSTAGGHQSTGAGGAYGSPYGAGGAGATSMQGSSGVMGGTPGTKRTYLPGYLSGGAAAQASALSYYSRTSRALTVYTNSTPNHHLKTTQTTEHGTRRRGRRPCPARQSLVTAATACLAANQGALPYSFERINTALILFVMRRTPSKSPRMSSYTAPPRKSAYRQEIEEDAPPVASLNEFESGDYAGSQMDSGWVDHCAPARAFAGLQSTLTSEVLGRSRLASSHDPTASPFAAASAPLPSHSTAHSKEGYSVYVFGFPAAATDLVLDFFTQFGEIVSTTPSTEGGNWVTITYAQAWSAARAARKNGEILGGALMIGVKAVDEDGLRRALAGAEGGQDLVPSAPSATSGPRQNGNTGGGATSTPSGVGRPVNVLGPQSAFKAAPTPTRKGFLGLGGGGSGGGATATSTPSGADPHASLFAEKSKQAALAQQPQQKGVLGKVSDMVFGW